MRQLKQFLLFLIIFIGAFSASGEAYIFYLNSVSVDCDYYFECHLHSDTERAQYAQQLKKYGKQLDLDIYTIDYRPVSHNLATYTVYTINKEVESIVKNRFKVHGNKEFNSIFSGKRKIIFKDISEIKNNSRIVQYQVMGDEDNLDKFRSLTIDEYGTGKAYDGAYSGDHFFILLSAWSLSLLIIVFITLIESASLRKEISVKYINGHNKSKIISIIISKNVIILTLAAILAVVIANGFTAATAFGTYLIYMIVGIILLSSIVIYLQLRLKDIKKIFNNVANNKIQRVAGIVFLSLTLVLFTTSLSICIQNVHDAYKTIHQNEIWNKYKSYESVVFFSSEESPIANYDLDKKYSANFYNKYVNQYDITLSFNVASNGGMSGFNIHYDDTIVYANLNGAKKMELPIDVNKLKNNKLYVLLPYTLSEFQEKDSWNDLDFVLSDLKGKKNITPTYVSINKPYETTLLDIKMTNLSANCVKNPIIIIDTFSSINRNFATNMQTSMMKFNSKDDFENFIQKINYKEQVWYKDNVYKLYQQKCNTSIMIVTVNIVIAIILSLLFFITFYTVLKVEFQYRANEISIRKILGDTLIKRYSFIFNLINIIVIIAAFSLWIVGTMFHLIQPSVVFLSLILSYLTIFMIFILFTTIYEKRNIPKTLKGGY